MEKLLWFKQVLENEFEVMVDEKQISYEGNELYLDEIDESLIPSEMLSDLPESLLFETMVFDGEDGTEWLGIIGMQIDSREWHLQVILKDGEPVLRRRIEKENWND